MSQSPATQDRDRRTLRRNRHNPYEVRSVSTTAAQVAQPGVSVTTFVRSEGNIASSRSAGTQPHRDDGNGPSSLQPYAPVVNIERAGNTFTGVNYGQVIQVEEYNVLRNLPIHPDISGSLGDYFPDSRVEDESYILQWIDSTNPPELVLCVLGKVGVGKSTLAKHLAARLRQNNRLAAEVFFGFALPDWSVESVFRMLAVQLCGAYPVLKRAVSEAIDLDLAPSLSLEIRIQSFILEPIRLLRLGRPLVVLLDALDQWGAHPILTKALSCLTNETHLIRFISFGRPGLEDRFRNVATRPYKLSDVPRDVMVNYFRKRFEEVQWEYGRKPSSQTIDRLVNKAEGLFIWSSTLCSLLVDELSCPKPQDTLMAILQSQQSVGDHEILANLYHSAIDLRFPKPEHKAKLKVFIGAAVVLQEPLPVAAFASLASMEVSVVRKIQAVLGPLQTGQVQDSQDMVYPASSTYHLSVLEYFQSPDTPSHLALPINAFTSHFQLGKACLEELRCIPASPHPPFMSPMQRYAMKYWPTHIAHGTPCVSPTSDAEWRATPHCTILDSLSASQWQHWALTYLQYFLTANKVPELIDEPTPEASSTSTGDTAHIFISQVFTSLRDTSKSVTTGPSDPALAVAEVVVRLQHQSSGAWLDLAEVYRAAAEINELSYLVENALLACRNAADLDGGQGYEAHRQLAICLWLRFSRLGIRDDRDEAILLEKAVLLHTPPGHPDRAMSLNNLASSLDSLHNLTGSVESLDEAIVLHQEALLLRPPGHPDRAMSLNNLANSLCSHHKLTGTVQSLDEAIVLDREALLLQPPGHPDRAKALNNLASSLDSLHNLTGSVESLDKAIVLHQEALLLYPPGHPDRAMSLNNLASSLCSHHKLTGTVESLDEAIVLHQEALLLRPPGHPDRAMSLNNLASSLRSHHKLTGTVESLDEAIVLDQEALLLRPPGHPDRAMSLNNLAISLDSNHDLTGKVESLDEAIVLHREALLLRPPGHPDREISLNNLAISLDSNFRLTGATETLDEVIMLRQELLSLSPPGHRYHASAAQDLEKSLDDSRRLKGDI